MRQVSERALDAASAAGASYADCRVINRTVQKLTVKNGLVAAVELLEDEGVGVRVIVDGAWGFASVDVLDSPSVEAAARHAVEIARASSRVNHVAVRLAPGRCVADPCLQFIQSRRALAVTIRLRLRNLRLVGHCIPKSGCATPSSRRFISSAVR